MVDRSHDLPWFKFFASDWMSDVELQLMPLKAQGAFVRMLCFQWINGALPDDPKLAAQLCDIPESEIDEIWSEVREQFERTDEGKLFDPDLEAMREKIADYYEQKSRSGKKGARVTWGKTEDSDDAEDLVEEAAESSKL